MNNLSGQGVKRPRSPASTVDDQSTKRVAGANPPPQNVVVPPPPNMPTLSRVVEHQEPRIRNNPTVGAGHGAGGAGRTYTLPQAMNQWNRRHCFYACPNIVMPLCNQCKCYHM